MMRRLIFALLLVLVLAVSAFADASLFRGSGSLGSVQTIENSQGVFVPVEDVARLMGFSSSRSGEEVLLTRGASQIRVMAKSAAAWRGLSIIPLYSEPFERNGKLWVDSASAAALFQSFAGTGQNNRLRFNKNSGVLAQKVTPGVDVDYKKPDYTPTAVSVPSMPKIQASRTSTQAASTPAQAISAIQTQASQPAVASTSRASTFTAKSTRREAFKPGTNQKVKNPKYSGTIQGIRWTSSSGRLNKIMAVIEADENADPEVYIYGGKIHALFAGCIDNAEGLTSPFSNVKLEAVRSSAGIDMVFTPSGFTRAEKLVLTNPKRIALEFFFSSKTALTRTQTQQTQQTISLPSVQEQRTARKQAEAQKKAEQKVPALTNVPDRVPPIVIDGTKSRKAAEMTPPSSITIPTTPAGTRSARKTIVIDPGHGGKDPGASANGVVEKNVTLAIGLELQSILTARGYRVVMTRNSDTYPTLQDRTDLANRVNADLFVSVHVNALPSKKSMTGFEIYIMALPTDKDAMNLAKIENREYIEGKGMDTANVDRRTEMLLKILGDMQQNNKISESTDFAAALYNAGAINGLPMRRIAQAPFFVLRGAGMPAVLLETGFVTNAVEAQKLATRDYQQKIAQAMASGIMNYLR